jgi:hypothetical protein
MANEETGYNGHANYETWTVNQWLNDDQATQNRWAEIARNNRETSDTADALKDSYAADMPELNGVWADLMNAALSEVNWYEIAEDLRPEIHEGQTSSGSCKLDDIVQGIYELLPDELLEEFNLYDDSPDDDETRAAVFDEICDHLNDIAPEGLEFGAQEGDGACFGFWKIAEEED